MSISGIPINLAQYNPYSGYSVAMLGKTLDAAEAAGEAVVEMMTESLEQSITPEIGGNFDLSV
jgi:hypothetical protein